MTVFDTRTPDRYRWMVLLDGVRVENVLTADAVKGVVLVPKKATLGEGLAPWDEKAKDSNSPWLCESERLAGRVEIRLRPEYDVASPSVISEASDLADQTATIESAADFASLWDE